MNCCLDCIRFLNRRGYSKIGASYNKKYDSNELEEIVIIKNDNSKEVLNFSNNMNTNTKKVNIEKLSLIELKNIVNDEEDIIFDLKNIKLEKNNLDNSDNLLKYNSNIKTKGIVNNSNKVFSSVKNNNNINPKNKINRNKLIRKKNIKKKSNLNSKLKNTKNSSINNLEIKNKLFKEKLSDEDDNKELNFQILGNSDNKSNKSDKSNNSNNSKILNFNQNLRNRNDGLSDLEWDIISDDAF